MLGFRRLGAIRDALILFLLTASIAGALNGCVSMKNAGMPQPPKVLFGEIWGYLMRGHEAELTGSEPLTHVCYFSAGITAEGRITEAISRPVIADAGGLQPKLLLVISELSNSSLMHFSLGPAYGVRPLLIQDICRVSHDFDGVQIDFEAVSPADAQLFWDFLKELRGALPADKMLSVALPARTGPRPDAYDYTTVAPLVDRAVIMAYDEHWSTSSPGPVASLSWCSSVVDYAQSVMENDKIVMGLPLYGRAWQDKKLARAMGFQSVQQIIEEKKPSQGYQAELGPFFEYSEKVLVKVFYDDLRSLHEKLRLYRSRSVDSVAFWRIGLGPPELWSSIDKESLAVAPGAQAASGPEAAPGAEAVPGPGAATGAGTVPGAEAVPGAQAAPGADQGQPGSPTDIPRK